MKKISMLMAVLALAGMTACDPYQDAPGGTPAIVKVSVPFGGEATAPGTDSFWALADVGPVATEDGSVPAPAVFVTTNQLLDGSSIQAKGQDPSNTDDVGDCTPAGGATPWITVKKDGAAVDLANDAGSKWYTCYYPAAASNRYGSSVLIFRSNVPPDFATSPLSTATLDPSAVYEFTGTVKTDGGKDLPINVRVTTTAG